MTVLTPYHLRLDGLTVATNSFGVENVGGFDTVAGKRSGSHRVPWIPGEVESWGDFPEAKTRTFTVWCLPYDEDGAVTHPNGPLAHLRENLDTLNAILSKRNDFIAVELDVPTPSAGVETRSGRAKVVDAVPVDGTRKRMYRVPLRFPFPYWNVLPQVQVNGGTPFTGTQAFAVGGGATVHDITLTCSGDTVIEHVETGDTITVAGSAGTVTINLRNRTVTQAGVSARNLARPNRPWWMMWDPGTVTLEVTGAAVAAAYYPARE